MNTIEIMPDPKAKSMVQIFGWQEGEEPGTSELAFRHRIRRSLLAGYLQTVDKTIWHVRPEMPSESNLAVLSMSEVSHA